MFGSPLADAFFAATLGADATLLALAPGGIARNRPSQEAAFPFVVWQFLSGTTTQTASAVRIWLDSVYQVKAVGQGDSIASLKAVADRIDTLLDRAHGAVTGGTIVACTLEGEIAYEEVVAGVAYQHLGGRYRLLIQGS
jgi:hypothetical protein